MPIMMRSARPSRAFCDKEIVPHHDSWEEDGIVPREVWTAAGQQGVLGFMVPEEYGGGGVRDFRFNAVLSEEFGRPARVGPAFALQTDVVSPYLLDYANDEQKARWLPAFARGELIAAIAMTEPNTGSDLQGIRTTAVRDGDDYVLNGPEDLHLQRHPRRPGHRGRPHRPGRPAQGLSLLVVERGMPGFERGRKLDKIGLHAQDTAELFFDDVRVPAANLLGEEGRGFVYLMQNLPAGAPVDRRRRRRRLRERARDDAGLREGAQGVRQADRHLPAQPLRAGRAGDRDPHRARLRRPLHPGAQRRHAHRRRGREGQVVDHRAAEEGRRPCLQLHGGYGFMTEYPIAKAFVDARVQTIYGGTTEIMKEIIGRSMGI